jgi:hypothetical protein
MNPRHTSPEFVWTNTGHFFARIGGDAGERQPEPWFEDVSDAKRAPRSPVRRRAARPAAPVVPSPRAV